MQKQLFRFLHRLRGSDSLRLCVGGTLLVAHEVHHERAAGLGHGAQVNGVAHQLCLGALGLDDLLAVAGRGHAHDAAAALVEIAEDIAGYFVESEQIPTACALGVLVDRDHSVKAAGGYLIQLMPGAGEDTIAKVEGGIMAAGPVSAILDRDPDPEHLLRTVMSDFELKILETCPVSYKCYCSRQRVERALLSLGADELEGILREQGSCHMTCQFCDAVYDFDRQQLEQLAADARKK